MRELKGLKSVRVSENLCGFDRLNVKTVKFSITQRTKCARLLRVLLDASQSSDGADLDSAGATNDDAQVALQQPELRIHAP
jgi:hypothetical protein